MLGLSLALTSPHRAPALPTEAWVHFAGDDNITGFGLSNGAGEFDMTLVFRLTAALTNVSFLYTGVWNVFVDDAGTLGTFGEVYGVNTQSGVQPAGAFPTDLGTAHTLRIWAATTANADGSYHELWLDDVRVSRITTPPTGLGSGVLPFGSLNVMGIGPADWCPALDARRLSIAFNGAPLLAHADEPASAWAADARVHSTITDA